MFSSRDRSLSQVVDVSELFIVLEDQQLRFCDLTELCIDVGISNEKTISIIESLSTQNDKLTPIECIIGYIRNNLHLLRGKKNLSKALEKLGFDQDYAKGIFDRSKSYLYNYPYDYFIIEWIKDVDRLPKTEINKDRKIFPKKNAKWVQYVRNDREENNTTWFGKFHYTKKTPYFEEKLIREMTGDHINEFYYHATTAQSALSIAMNGIILEEGNLELDFSDGNGFQLYRTLNHAEKWAEHKKLIEDACLCIFAPDVTQMKDFQILNLHKEGFLLWSKIVKQNRLRHQQQYPLEEYDIIFGPQCKNGRDIYLGKEPVQDSITQFTITSQRAAKYFSSRLLAVVSLCY